MKNGFRRHATAAALTRTSPQKPLTPTPPREPVKRKGAHFEEKPSIEAIPSTSAFLESQGKDWAYIASCFAIINNTSHENRLKEDAELLQLCNFYGTEEDRPATATTSTEDDEYIPYAVFAEQGMRMSYKAPSMKEPTVSSLDLKGMLRIESNACISTDLKSERSDKQESLAPKQEDEQQIELAFQGNLPCANPQKSQKRRSSMTEKTQILEKVEEEEDFWNDVEF